MTDTKYLIAQRTGQVALSDELFTEDQQKVMGKVLTICDRNPVIVWKEKDPNHNLDFCLIEGKIEPVKGFCLKCIHVAGFSVESEQAPSITPVKLRDGGDDTLISVPVTIYVPGGPRFTLWGASSIRECDNYGKNKRALHDALARAQTRALKSAVETAVGMPFINALLAKLFGGFEVTGTPGDEGAGSGMRNVSPEPPTTGPKEDPESRLIWKRIWNMLKTGEKAELVSQAEIDTVTEEVKANMNRPNILLDIEQKWTREILARSKAAKTK
jgi:hypothetical protein